MPEERRHPKVTPLGAGRYLVDAGQGPRVAFGVTQGALRWVFLEGDVFVFGAEDKRRHAAAADDGPSLSAPMPARVLSIAVQVGQRVAAGDVLVTLEAMKMELPVRAPRDGTVAAISCQTGRMVNAGDTLIDLQ